MGQNLFSPPNVKGWPGGEVWINSSTLLARKQFLDRMFRADDPAGRAAMAPEAMAPVSGQVVATGAVQETDTQRQIRFMRAMDRGFRSVQFESATWLTDLHATDATRVDAATRLLLAYPPQSPPDPASEPLAMVRHIVLDASYQLK
jgi:hypothetical protein